MVAVDVDGSFVSTSTIPVVGAGAQTVTAADGAGKNADANPATFTVTPTLALSPSSGLAGSKVAITGSGWVASADVDLTFGGAVWTTVTATATGTLAATGVATLIAAQPGVKAVVGNDGTNTASTNFTVDPRIMNLTPSSGPMGTKVLITGGDMSPDSEVPIAVDPDPRGVRIGGVEWNTAAIPIDSTGVLSPTTLTVPTGLLVGENIVAVVDSMGLGGGNIFVVTKPTVSINPATGPRGSAVTVQGSGWVPNSTVSLNFAGSLMTVIADANGNIAAAMNVPAAAATGANSVTAADALGNSAKPGSFSVPNASISVSPVEGGPGTAVTVSGTGFGGYAPITVTFGGYQLPTTPLSSPLGEFSLATTVPGVAPGAQVVQASDTTATATTFFVVTAAELTTASQLATIMDDLVIVWGYIDGVWEWYDPLDAGSTLDTLDAGIGYWIQVLEAVELIFGGNSYDLDADWNLMGWRG
jgi:hypothetical protein